MGDSLSRVALAVDGGRLEYLEILLKVFVQFHHRGHVPASVVVVGGRPYRHQLLIEHVFVAFHH